MSVAGGLLTIRPEARIVILSAILLMNLFLIDLSLRRLLLVEP